MRNLRLELCYDGTRYRGWQRLPGVENTLQGKIEQTLSRILGEPIELSGSGRTDAGVHAAMQVASFHCTNPLPAPELLAQLRRYLPEDIGVIACREASPRFHARLNAKQKTYLYRIWNSELPCVFQRRYVTVIQEPLDVSAMEDAAGRLVGEHDFSAFCKNARIKKSTVRTLYAIEITRQGEELRLRYTGNGFLQGMVRILTGTLIEVGLHQRQSETVEKLFGSARAEAGFLAPAQGLILQEVQY